MKIFKYRHLFFLSALILAKGSVMAETINLPETWGVPNQIPVLDGNNFQENEKKIVGNEESSGVGTIPLSTISSDFDCEINLADNCFGCRIPEAISFVQGPADGRAVVRLLLDPHKTEFTKARIELLYGEKIEGHTLNIGDSISNNGFGGDGADQTHDSEAQIVGNDMTIFGDDMVPEGEKKVLGKCEGLAGPGVLVTFDIENNSLAWRNDRGADGLIQSPYLFCLDGQEDKEGPVNYDIYVGLNQVVAGSYRSGTGVKRVRIKLTH